MDKEQLAEFFRPKEIKRCSVGALNLSDEQREKLNAALSYPNEEIPNTAIIRVLRDWGFEIGRTVLGEHRRKACCCND